MMVGDPFVACGGKSDGRFPFAKPFVNPRAPRYGPPISMKIHPLISRSDELLSLVQRLSVQPFVAVDTAYFEDPNMANVAALLWEALPDLNWAGFYRNVGGELVLGPFQGRPACIRIPFGKGVCGVAAATREAQCVADVHAFPGHIACDAASRAELVVPLLHDGALIGVLDLDSPLPGRFDAEDLAGCVKLAQRLEGRLGAMAKEAAEG